MTKRPNKKDVEKVALAFATQLIDFSDDGKRAFIYEDTVNQKSVELAVDWLRREELRSIFFEHQYPNWIELNESNVSEDLVSGDEYWFVVQAHEEDKLAEVVKAKVMSISPFALENMQNYKVLRFIPKENSDMFEDGFQPEKPRELKLPSELFSPNVKSQD